MMRFLATLIIFFIFTTLFNTSLAQSRDSLRLGTYGEVGFGYGSHNILNITVNSLFAKNNILSVIGSMAIRDGIYTPLDYKHGAKLFGNGIPNEKVYSLGIMYGKMLRSGASFARFSLKGGVGYSLVTMPAYFKPSNTFLGPNYTHGRKETHGLSLIFNPTVELPFFNSFGMSVGFLSTLNKERSTFGAVVSILLLE